MVQAESTLDKVWEIDNLTPHIIDYMIAKILEFDVKFDPDFKKTYIHLERLSNEENEGWTEWSPTTYWCQGGPLLQEYSISVELYHKAEKLEVWMARWGDSGHKDYKLVYGQTQLEAGMKSVLCFLLKSDLVDVPKEVT